MKEEVSAIGGFSPYVSMTDGDFQKSSIWRSSFCPSAMANFFQGSSGACSERGSKGGCEDGSEGGCDGG